MIKPIRVEQLQTGMYIHDLKCNWLKHGFLQPRFLLKRDADLERIRQLGIRELLIDIGKGSNVATAPSVREVESPAEQPRSDEPPPAPLADERAQAKEKGRAREGAPGFPAPGAYFSASSVIASV